MKKLTKLLTLMAVLITLIAAVTLTAAAAGENNFTYTEGADGLYITGYNGELPTDLVFPSQLNGKTVVGITDFWVDGTGVKTVTIPDTIQKTYGLNFFGWESLETVNMGAGVQNINCDMFGDCFALKAVNVSPNNPSYCSIDGVVYTKDMTALIYLPEGKTTVAQIPATVSDLSILTWNRAANIQVDAASQSFVTQNGLTYTKDGKTLIRCNLGTAGGVTVPNTITDIYTAAFAGCANLTAVTLPEGITEIVYMQFLDCSSLQQVNVPASVETIGYKAFSGCTAIERVDITDVGAWCNIDFYGPKQTPLYYAKTGNLYLNGSLLQNLQIPEGVTQVKSYAFAGADSVKYIALPTTLEAIDYNAFDSCDGITTLTIPGNVARVGSSAFARCSNLKTLDLCEGIRWINDSAFSSCTALEEVTLPASLEALDYGAFGGCTALTKLTVLSGNTILGTRVFRDCPLSQVELPDDMTVIEWESFSESAMERYSVPSTVTEISYRAFYNCDQLTEVNIPASVTNIWISAFAGCNKLEGIWVDPNNPNYCNDTIGALYSKDMTNLRQLPGGYVGCYRVPEGVTDIDDRAFYDSKNLATVTLPGTLKNLGGSAFQDSSIICLTVPEGVETITYFTFAGCSNLKSIYLPESLTFIAGRAFGDCSNLKDIYYGGTEAQWDAIIIDGWNNEALENATIHYNSTGIPAGWQKTGNDWFYLNSNGSFATGWKLLGSKWYLFGENGFMKTGWQELGNDWYYFTANGDMVTGTVTIGGKQHRFDSSGAWQGEVVKAGWISEGGKWYYYDANSNKITGWKEIDKVWYYFTADGAMVTGTVTIDGKQHRFATSGAWQGEIVTSGWLLQSGKWYYYDTNGKKLTGWQQIGAAWYYFNNAGVMQTGWVKSGNTWYYFQSSGAMATGWVKSGNTWYYFASSGAMATGWLKSGNTWYYFGSSGAMATGWLKSGNTWYYFNASGAMATGNVKLGNKTYRFNASGACLNP